MRRQILKNNIQFSLKDTLFLWNRNCLNFEIISKKQEGDIN